MAIYPKTWDGWLREQDQIVQMSNDAVDARMEEWLEECRSIYATQDADWAAVAHLPFGHPERSALADRELIATRARDRYVAEQRAMRVDQLRAEGKTREEFALAMGLGLIPQDDF